MKVFYCVDEKYNKCLYFSEKGNPPYGLYEYREGCIQHCDDCDYYQPIERGK